MDAPALNFRIPLSGGSITGKIEGGPEVEALIIANASEIGRCLADAVHAATR